MCTKAECSKIKGKERKKIIRKKQYTLIINVITQELKFTWKALCRKVAELML